MAARAHAIHDYSFAGASARPRRQVWLRDDDDEVVLPRGRGSSITGALVVSALLATAFVGGATYAIYRSAPPPTAALAETPSVPLQKEWQADPMFAQANVAKALRPPAPATPAAAVPVASPDSEANSDVPAGSARMQAQEPREVILNDSAPGFQESLPQPTQEPSRSEPALTQPVLPEPGTPEPALPRTETPYPPVTTPPEMVQPTSPEPESRTDPENPY